MGDITVPFVEAAVERMFNADEVTSIVDLAKLECLKRTGGGLPEAIGSHHVAGRSSGSTERFWASLARTPVGRTRRQCPAN
jgi:hypothetical protein